MLFENANVLPMDRNRVLERQNVLVENGRIAAVGRRVKAPKDAVRVDATGKFLMPGLAEMHGHLPAPPTPPAVIENILYLFASNGVTTVRGMLGHPSHLELRARIGRGELLGPTLYVAGPALGGNNATSPEIARQMVRDQKTAGYDHLKVQEGLRRDVYDAIVEEARAQKMTFGGHVSQDVGVQRAIEARQTSIDHLDNYIDALDAGDTIAALAKSTREAGVW
ncbi:MAG: amidohydrolase family protein, partial [bacterium]